MQYGKGPEYWNERYARDAEPYDWYHRWTPLANVLSDTLETHHKILNIGCGNSRMSEEMYDVGFKDITNIDISDVCIEQMKEKYKDRKGLSWEVQDVTAMHREIKETYDVVIDKGTFDSVMCGPDATKAGMKMLQEVKRVLKEEGVYICISHGQPDYRLPYLGEPKLGWKVNISALQKPYISSKHDAPEVERDNQHYIYICEKVKKENEYIGALRRRQEMNQRIESTAQGLDAEQLTQAKAQFEQFQQALQEFATKHRSKINSDPAFRQKFHEMCLATGVDPLVSTRGFWSDILGVSTFYAELGVQVLTICLAARAETGGLMELDDCTRRIQAHARKQGELSGQKAARTVSSEDVAVAVGRCQVLGGVSVVTLSGGKKFIVTMPQELSSDQNSFIDYVNKNKGCVTKEQIYRELRWTPERLDPIIHTLQSDGIVWVDAKSFPVSYWIPTIALAQ